MIFTMGKRANFNLLSEKITETKDFTHVIKLYGKAIKTFNE
jgi:hypothetical protein